MSKELKPDIKKLLDIYGLKLKEYLSEMSLTVEDKLSIGKYLYKVMFKDIIDDNPTPKVDQKDPSLFVKKVSPPLLNYNMSLYNNTIKKIPIVLSVNANQDLIPYVVSATSPKRMIQWVTSHDEGLIALGILSRSDITEEEIFNRIITEVIATEKEHMRGNILLYYPDDRESLNKAIQGCIAYLRYYSLESYTILHNVSVDIESYLPTSVRAHWLSPGRVVVLPKDLSYFGDIFLVGRKHFAISVHNITRGVSICLPMGDYKADE